MADPQRPKWEANAILLGGGGAALLAALGLLAYLPGLALLGRLRSDYIPMAPSTALCFLLLGVTLVFLARHTGSLGRRLAVGAGVVVALFGALELAGYWAGRDLSWEDRFIPEAGVLGGVPLARMSPATGGLFVLAGASLLLLARAQNRPGRSRTWAGFLGGLAAICGFTLQLGYLYGTPLLYQTGTIPVAVTTAAAFLFLGSGLVAGAGAESLPLRPFLGTATTARLLRVFLPLVVVGVLVNGTIARFVPPQAGMNEALVAAILAAATALLTGWVAIRVAHTVGAAIDTAERGQREAERSRGELEQQLHQARRLESLGRLAGGVAHDFNNLLTAIIGFTESALSRLSPDDRSYTDLKEVQRAGERAAELTAQLLAFGRKQVMRPEVVDLNSLIGRTESMLRRTLGETIHLDFRPGAELWRVKADPGQLEQVLLNLATNARDAMPAGGLLLIETRNVSAREGQVSGRSWMTAGRYVVLSVTDEGHGMDQETLAQIFEPFFSTKPKGKGTGLGLATVYGIVKQNQWEIEVESEPGTGASFTLFLSATDEPLPTQRAAAGATHLTGTETILLVEDEAVVRRMTRSMLEQAGFQVLAAAGGEEALALASGRTGPLDLLLSDVVMPGLSGPQVYQRLREVRPEIRVLFVSGYPKEELARQGTFLAGTSLLPKPFRIEALLRAVRAALDLPTIPQSSPGGDSDSLDTGPLPPA